MAGEERWRKQRAGLSEWVRRWERFLRCVRLALSEIGRAPEEGGSQAGRRRPRHRGCGQGAEPKRLWKLHVRVAATKLHKLISRQGRHDRGRTTDNELAPSGCQCLQGDARTVFD